MQPERLQQHGEHRKPPGQTLTQPARVVDICLEVAHG